MLIASRAPQETSKEGQSLVGHMKKKRQGGRWKTVGWGAGMEDSDANQKKGKEAQRNVGL